MQIKLFTKQKQTHRHRKQTLISHQKVRCHFYFEAKGKTPKGIPTDIENKPMVTRREAESESESRSVVFDSLRPHGLYSPLNSPGQNTGVGRLSLLQGTFLTQESYQALLHCRQGER